jgi:hypothetical protein
MLSVIKLNVVMLNVIKLNVVMPRIAMLSVVTPLWALPHFSDRHLIYHHLLNHLKKISVAIDVTTK